jgi:hypothetical protein
LFLDTLIQIIAWLIIIVPIAFLAGGAIASYYFRFHRQTIGILLIVFGIVGALIFSNSIYNIIRREMFEILTLYIALLSIEIATIVTGIISLRHVQKRESYL